MRKSQDLQVSTTPHEFLESVCYIPYNTVHKRRGKTEYIDLTATLDIETTNTDTDGFAYSFQMCVGGQCVVVRYIEDLVEVLDGIIEHYMVSNDRRLVIYVHNLGYEHFYMTQILTDVWGMPESLFTKPRKPLSIRYPIGIEFRDSLKLFQKSLARATVGCKHEKLVGDLDYTVYRTPDTPLTQEEFDYCVNDVIGLWEAIERLKKEHGYNQATIPFTNTGMVIEAVNAELRKERGQKTRNEMRKLDLNKEQLRLAYLCMAGGDTHGTRWRAGNVYDNCNSYDLKSAHPSQQILRKFPCGKPVTMPHDLCEEDLDAIEAAGYGWLGKIYVHNWQIRPECPNPTVSFSKCSAVNGLRGKDNGRVMGAEDAFIYMDSNDWWRFKQAYTYEDVVGVEILAFYLDCLPPAFRGAILDKFKVKESAEDGPDRNFAKICVNTIFGGCAQKTVRDEYSVDIGEIMTCDTTKWEDNLDGKTDDEVYKTQRNKFPFLWGLWTASLSRRKLFELQMAVGWENLIYWDTDSCKYEGEKMPTVDAYNDEVRAQCIARDAVCQNRKGEFVYIGVAEDEHPMVRYGYKRFTFLHAKCYAAEAYDKNIKEYVVESTIAGVGKKNGVAALQGDIANLQNGLYIADAGGLALSYHDRPITKRTEWKRPTNTASYIVMKPRQYLVTDSRDSLEIREDEIIVE